MSITLLIVYVLLGLFTSGSLIYYYKLYIKNELDKQLFDKLFRDDDDEEIEIKVLSKNQIN